jgi:4-amino-4-deoxy-L-arabinose transferase-like glycosyltransferase
MGANNGFQIGAPVTSASPAGGAPSVGQNGFGGGTSLFGGNRAGGFGRGGFGGGGFGGGGFAGTGNPGPVRLFISPLNKETSWLLPFGLFAALLALFGAKLKWPLSEKHQALVLWGGWLVTAGIFFSVAGFFHEYYLSMLAAPLAALVAIGFAELASIGRKHPWLAAILLVLAAGASLDYEISTAQAYTDSIPWQPVTYVFFLVGVALVVLDAASRSWKDEQPVDSPAETADPAAPSFWGASIRRPLTVLGTLCVAAALLITPGAWSWLTNLNSSSNQSLPAAYGGGSTRPASLTGLSIDSSLLAYLQKNTQSNKYLMAVPSSMQGSDYVLATGRPVLYMGGFMGQDAVLNAAQLAKLVADGDLRYIYWSGGRGGGMNVEQDVTAWVTSHCTAVTGYDTATQNSGAPDGTSANGARTNGGGFGGFGDMQVSLYDCGS